MSKTARLANDGPPVSHRFLLTITHDVGISQAKRPLGVCGGSTWRRERRENRKMGTHVSRKELPEPGDYTDTQHRDRTHQRGLTCAAMTPQRERGGDRAVGKENSGGGQSA